MKKSLLLCGTVALCSAAVFLFDKRVKCDVKVGWQVGDSPPEEPKATSEYAQVTLRQGESEVKAYTPTPSPGRIVHFVLPEGEIRPAIITENLEGRTHMGEQPIACTVFLSVLDDGTYKEGKPSWRKCPVFYDEAKSPGSWHWPQRT